MYLIGVDIGGTNLKVGLIKNNAIVDKIIVPTNSFDIIRQIVGSVQEIISNNSLQISDICGVGVGCPGLIQDGLVIKSPNLNLFNFEMAKFLEEELQVKVIVKNDADMATLAEYRLGAGVGSNNMLMFTIGTGVGGGVIHHGSLLEGNAGFGEFGHTTLYAGGIECNCGRRGCMEQYVSLKAFDRRAREFLEIAPENDGLIQLSKIMEDYDSNETIRNLVDGYVADLTEVVLNFCNTFRPDKIVIGGGIAYTPVIIDRIATNCKKQNYGYIGSNPVEIVKATLANDAGMLGTAVLFN